MKNLAVICVLIFVSGSLAKSIPIPSANEEEDIDPIIDATLVNIEGNLTPILQETKDISDFFDFLTEMRREKSLSIVGKDNKYIYLLVADKNQEDKMEEEKIDGDLQEDHGRTRRSILLKTLGKGLGLIGPTGVRMIAVPISLFNYLGYLPMRLPGVPYHIDSGSPDAYPYDTVNHFYH